MMRNSSETICDPGDDEGSYGDEDELSTTSLRFPTENREDEDEPQREEFEPAEVQVSHKIHELDHSHLSAATSLPNSITWVASVEQVKI